MQQLLNEIKMLLDEWLTHLDAVDTEQFLPKIIYADEVDERLKEAREILDAFLAQAEILSTLDPMWVDQLPTYLSEIEQQQERLAKYQARLAQSHKRLSAIGMNELERRQKRVIAIQLAQQNKYLKEANRQSPKDLLLLAIGFARLGSIDETNTLLLLWIASTHLPLDDETWQMIEEQKPTILFIRCLLKIFDQQYESLHDRDKLQKLMVEIDEGYT